MQEAAHSRSNGAARNEMLVGCPASHCRLITDYRLQVTDYAWSSTERSTAAAQKAKLLNESCTASNCIDYAQHGANIALLQPKKQICWMSLVQPAIALIMHKKVQKSVAAAQKAELLDEPHTASKYVNYIQKGAREALLQPEQLFFTAVQPAEDAHLLPQHFNSRICISDALGYPLWGATEPQTEVMLLVDKVWSVAHSRSLVIPLAGLTEQAFP